MIGAIKLLELKYVARGKKMHMHFENFHKLRIMCFLFSQISEDLLRRQPQMALRTAGKRGARICEPGCKSFATTTRSSEHEKVTVN